MPPSGEGSSIRSRPIGPSPTLLASRGPTVADEPRPQPFGRRKIGPSRRKRRKRREAPRAMERRSVPSPGGIESVCFGEPTEDPPSRDGGFEIAATARRRSRPGPLHDRFGSPAMLRHRGSGSGVDHRRSTPWFTAATTRGPFALATAPPIADPPQASVRASQACPRDATSRPCHRVRGRASG